MINYFKKTVTSSTFVILLGGALTACGGGSDSADNEATTGTITAACARNNSTIDVTQEGCLAEVGKNTQSIVCSAPNTQHMLTGTGWTREQLIQSGSKTVGRGGVSINGVSIRCI